MRTSLVLAVGVLCGCRQLLGFESVNTDDDDASVSDDASADAADPLAKCPSTYTKFTNDRVYRLGVVTDWITAAVDCANDANSDGIHTHLVVLDDDAERVDVLAFSNGESWIGLTDRITPGTFIPVTDQDTTYPPASGVPWATGEPNGDCGHSRDAGLDADLCSQPGTTLCECDTFPNDVTNYEL